MKNLKSVISLEVSNLKHLLRTETFKVYIIQIIFAIVVLGLVILLLPLLQRLFAKQ